MAISFSLPEKLMIFPIIYQSGEETLPDRQKDNFHAHNQESKLAIVDKQVARNKIPFRTINQIV